MDLIVPFLRQRSKWSAMECTPSQLIWAELADWVHFEVSSDEELAGHFGGSMYKI